MPPRWAGNLSAAKETRDVRWPALLRRRKFRYAAGGAAGSAALGAAVVWLPFVLSAALLGLVGTITAAGAVAWYLRQPVFRLHHAPARVSRRHGVLSANFCGTAHFLARITYRVNGHDWVTVTQAPERSRRPNFTIEVEPESLRDGDNTIEFRVRVPGRQGIDERVSFSYDPAPVRLPAAEDWRDPVLESQDGCWEVIETLSGNRVRPCPGTEAYDRILLVTGAFPAPRRIETDVIYVGRGASRHPQFGFGLLSLWGGHPDEPGHRPRRGWRYAAAWYFSSYGANAEFSVKEGADRRWDATSLVNGRVQPHGHYRVVAECCTEHDSAGRHLRHRQRMKWWPADEPEPDEWIECAEAGRARLPPGEYAVALLAHQCQVEFGKVHVHALESP